MFLGGLLLIDGPIPEMRVNIWTALAVSLPPGSDHGLSMTIALKARRNKVVTGEQGMIGEVAIVCAPLRLPARFLCRANSGTQSLQSMLMQAAEWLFAA